MRCVYLPACKLLLIFRPLEQYAWRLKKTEHSVWPQDMSVKIFGRNCLDSLGLPDDVKL